MDKVSSFLVNTFNKVESIPIVKFASIIILVAVVFSYTQNVVNDPALVKIIGNPIVQLPVIFVGLLAMTKDLFISLIITVVLSILPVLRYMSQKQGFELIWPSPDTNPLCVGIKKDDLVKAFGGDEMKLKQAVYEAGVPTNVEINDYNAPLIATYLFQLGHTFSDTCSPDGFNKSALFNNTVKKYDCSSKGSKASGEGEQWGSQSWMLGWFKFPEDETHPADATKTTVDATASVAKSADNVSKMISGTNTPPAIVSAVSKIADMASSANQVAEKTHQIVSATPVVSASNQ